MLTFNNLPGHYVFKEDGALGSLPKMGGNVTVVIGTSSKGPAGFQYNLGDTNEFIDQYDGELHEGLFHALLNGAENVAAYRLGVTHDVLDFVNGFTIVVAKGELGDYKLYSDGSSEFIISSDDGVVHYDYANGGQKTNNVFVFGDFADYAETIGSASTPVSLGTLTSYEYAHSYTIDTTNKTISDSKAGMKFMQYDNSSNSLGLVEVKYSINGTGHVDEFNTNTDSVKLSIRYNEGSDGTSLSLSERYLALERAYLDLESADVDVVIPMGVYLDSDNVVDNVGNISANGSALGLGHRFEYNGDIFFAFNNGSSDADGTVATALPSPYELGLDGYPAKAWLEGTHRFEDALKVASDADIDALSDNIDWYELNFAHQLAKFVYKLSLNDNEASGVIGVKPYLTSARRSVMQWLGKLPTKDNTGTIVVSGSGILGNKIMSGSITVAPGLYYTTNEMYGGTPYIDARTNNPLDIGSAIDVVASVLFYDGAYMSAAAAYAGLIGRLRKNEPIMGKELNNRFYAVPYGFKKADFDKMIQAHYASVKQYPNGLIKVVDAPTAALNSSDYTSRFTSRLVAGTIDAIRRAAEPFIGGISGPSAMIALQESINSTLMALQQEDNKYLISGLAEVRQTAQQRIDGEAVVKLVLRVPGELRRITTYVLLSK